MCGHRFPIFRFSLHAISGLGINLMAVSEVEAGHHSASPCVVTVVSLEAKDLNLPQTL